MGLRQALIAAALALSPALAAAQVERFAVVVGNDTGQAPDGPLRWAEADAARVAAVLQEVGGVRPENLVLLRGQDGEVVRRTLIAVNERVRAAGPGTVLFVYYSGHADAEALHLGPTSLPLRELEQLVRGSAASFRLLVLDACRSGALTRVKGGTPIPPFELRLGERVPGEGAVFLTSSSASEDSQESDDLKGSFFTTALVSGLLGAADRDGDGRVTLEEVYRHAYDATVRASSRTLAGLQHPTFEYDVRGQGDVVLATLAGDDRARTWLTFPEGIGWLVLQGSADGPVVGEIGRADRVRRLSVRAGTYFLRGRGPDVLLEGTQPAPPGATVAVEPSRLARTTYARLVRKGLGEPGAASSVEVEGRVRGALASEGRPCAGLAVGTALALRPLTLVARLGACRSGFAEGGLTATTDDYDLELGAVHAWDLPGLSLEVGLTAGGALLRQRFRTAGVAPSRTTAALQLSPVAAISRDVGARGYLFASLSPATYLFRVEDSTDRTTSLRPSFALRFALGAGWRR
jgi:caspase domain-containing protein